MDVKVTTLEMASSESIAGAIARNCAGYSIAPVAMIAPCPGIRRGTEAVVPSVPGLVSEIVVPSKSGTLILPVRARRTTSSAAATNSAKLILSAPFTFGTSSVRDPSDFGTSTARPNRTSSRRTRAGSPLEPSNASFMPGKDLSARMRAQDTRWVKEILDCSSAARCSLMRRRFSSASLIGTCRCVVAVGTPRLASMFSAIRSAPPRRVARSPSTAGPRGVAGLAGAAGTGTPAAAVSGSPKRCRKYRRHSSSTAAGFVRKRLRSSAT